MANLLTISNNSNYNLRSNNYNFFLSKLNTNLLKKSISYSGAMSWNKLTNDCKKNPMKLFLKDSSLCLGMKV